MKLERTKNAGKSMIFEVLKNFYGTIMSFIMRTVMIYYLGMEYTGLGGLFSSVLSILNLAELGVGTAMIFSMYKPIAEDDTKKICALMALYKKYMRIIGGVILSMGIILIPFLKGLISGEVPEDINIYILFLMNLSVTVLSYWLFAYKNCLLLAHQQNYISEKIDLTLNIVFSISQLISLVVISNYYVYLGLELARQITSNLVKSYTVSKIYPEYRTEGKLEKKEEKEIKNRVKDLFTAKLGGTITQSADTIVISAFLGLTVLAQYQNYYYIFTAISTVVGVVFNATRAGIGNSLVCENKEKNLNDLYKFTFLMVWICTICATGLIGVYQPFIILWVGEENLLPFNIVVCLAIMFVGQQYRRILETYKTAAGIWHSDRFRPLISGLVNLVLNLILVNYIGLYGVVLSTIVSEVFISIPWIIQNSFKYIFECSSKKYILESVKYIIIAIMIVLLSYLIIEFVPIGGIITLILRMIFAVTIPNILLFVVYIKTNIFKESFGIIKNMIRK